jgi:hypothetical protein
MNEIPHAKEYSLPYLSSRLICTNCDCRGERVRRLKREHRKVTDYKLFWLCPKCFKKMILDKGREEVEFT